MSGTGQGRDGVNGSSALPKVETSVENVWLPLEELREVDVALEPQVGTAPSPPVRRVGDRASGVGTRRPWFRRRFRGRLAGVTLLVVRAKEPTFGMGHWFWYYLMSTFGQAGDGPSVLVASATMKTLSARSLGGRLKSLCRHLVP